MNTEELLKAATPRPWALDGDFITAPSTPGQGEIAEFFKADGGDGFLDQNLATVNAQLAVLAVNCFEAQRELIADLVKLLRDCDNLLMEHHRAGFEQEWKNNTCPACSKPSDGHQTIFYRIQSVLARAREALK